MTEQRIPLIVSCPTDEKDPSPCMGCKALKEWSDRQWQKLEKLTGEDLGILDCWNTKKEGI